MRARIDRQRGVARPQRALHQYAVDTASEFEADRSQRPRVTNAETPVQGDRTGIVAIPDHRDHLTPGACFATMDEGGKESSANPAAAQAVIDIDRVSSTV